jgi:GNAT superfamily N-acetyltransferase
MVELGIDLPQEGRTGGGYLVRHAVSVRGESVCGGNVLVREPWREPGFFELAVYVDPAYRRSGIGHTLVEEVESEARREGATLLKATIAANDVASLAFARRRGYQIVQTFTANELLVEKYDALRLQPMIDALLRAGYRFFTFAEAGETEANRRQLYELTGGKRSRLKVRNGLGSWALATVPTTGSRKTPSPPSSAVTVDAASPPPLRQRAWIM